MSVGRPQDLTMNHVLFPSYCNQLTVKNITTACVSFRSSLRDEERNELSYIKV